MHDGFISYSHGADGRLAPALQTALQRFAKPWYRRRALDIFRDDTGLSASPHLWTSIQSALDGARYFILLASPDAAESPWVGKEVEHWLATKTAARQRILPVLTDGDLVWDDARGDYDPVRSTALPTALRGQFVEEPRHVDLRWARTEAHLDLRNGRFRDAVADLAATIHGVSKDEIEGQDVRGHRRAIRTAIAAVVVLVVLTLAALGSAALAVRAQHSANDNAARADHQAAVARRNLARSQSRQLVTAVETESSGETALLLAVQANELAVTPESRSELFFQLRSYAPADAGVSLSMSGDRQNDTMVRTDEALPEAGDAVALSAGGVVALADGRRVTLLDVADPARVVGTITGVDATDAPVALTPDGRTLLVVRDGALLVATPDQQRRLDLPGGSPRRVVVDRSGSGAWALLGPGDAGDDARLVRIALGPRGAARVVASRSLPPEAGALQPAGARRVVVRTDVGLGIWGAGGAGIRRAGAVRGTFDPEVAVSPDGRYAFDLHRSDEGIRTLRVWNLRTGVEEAGKLKYYVGSPNADAVRLVFSPDGRTLALLATYGSYEDEVAAFAARYGLSTDASNLVVQPAQMEGWGDFRYAAPGTVVQLFDVRSLQEVGRMFPSPREPLVAGFTRDGRGLAWVDDASAHTLDLDLRGTWIPTACRLAQRALTPADLTQYLGTPVRGASRACAASGRVR